MHRWEDYVACGAPQRARRSAMGGLSPQTFQGYPSRALPRNELRIRKTCGPSVAQSDQSVVMFGSWNVVFAPRVAKRDSPSPTGEHLAETLARVTHTRVTWITL